MFGWMKPKNRDIIAEAFMRAKKEKNEEIALARFLETIHSDSATIEALRATYRTAIEELCDQHHIQDVVSRQSIQQRLWSNFPQNLQRTAKAYLRDGSANA